MIKVYNEDCRLTLKKIKDVNVILTSPPYNTSEQSSSAKGADRKNLRSRYDVFIDSQTDEQYLDFLKELFISFDRVLAKDGVVLFNLSYSAVNPSLIWLAIAYIINNTPFMVADCIVWKKGNAMPQNQNPNRLTRICEFVFVLCRKTEALTFQCNKPKGKKMEHQQRYLTVPNFVRAPNNDGETPDLNRATFSTSLCLQLLKIYARDGDLVYDPFMGTGTTAVACRYLGLDCIGSEISRDQCLYAKQRLSFKLAKGLFHE